MRRIIAVLAIVLASLGVGKASTADAYLSQCFVVPTSAYSAYSDCHLIINNGGNNLQRVHLYCGDDIGGIVAEATGYWVLRGTKSSASCPRWTPGILYRSYDLL